MNFANKLTSLDNDRASRALGRTAAATDEEFTIARKLRCRETESSEQLCGARTPLFFFSTAEKLPRSEIQSRSTRNFTATSRRLRAEHRDKRRRCRPRSSSQTPGIAERLEEILASTMLAHRSDRYCRLTFPAGSKCPGLRLDVYHGKRYLRRDDGGRISRRARTRSQHKKSSSARSSRIFAI